MQMEFTPRGLLATFFRQNAKFWIVFFLILAGGVYYVLTAKPMYQAAGSMIIRFGQSAAPDVGMGSGRPTELSQNDRREIIQSNIDIMYSHDLLKSLIEEVGVEAVYPELAKNVKDGDKPIESAINRLAKQDLTIKAGQSSNIVDVLLVNPDPQMAERMAKRLFTLFIARQSEVYNKPATAFMQEQLQLARGHLEESQNKLEEFKARTGISSIDEEMTQLRRDRGETANIGIKSMDDAQDKLIELQAKEAELLTTYRPDSPAVRQVRRSIGLLQNQYHARRSDLRDDGTSNNSVLASRLARIDQRIAELEFQRKEFNDLQRQVTIDEESYRNYQSRGEEARINDVLNQQNITRIAVVDEPVAASRPVRPRKKLILAVCLIAAMLAGLGVAGLFETFDERFSTPNHLASGLKLPVMASFATARGK